MKKMSFLDFTGDSEENVDGSYTFKMKEEDDFVDKEGYIEVTSPVIDNAFQKIFGQNENITKDLLNSIIFPNKDRIKQITFLPTNYAGPVDKKYSFDSIRADVLCKCYLSKDQNDDEELEIIIDIEMQIEFNKDNTKRFIKYLKTLYSNYGNIKIIVLALVFRNVPNPYSNEGSKTYIKESRIDYSKEELALFDEFPIYQIDIGFCYKLIFTKKESIWIINKDRILQKKGEEWIKYFNIPNWCGFYRENYYAFPRLDNISFQSKEVYQAMKILSKQDKAQYEMHLFDWKKRLENYELFEKLKIENEKQKIIIKNQKEKINQQEREIKSLKNNAKSKKNDK